MNAAQLPADEAQRLAKLRSLAILDTEPEAPFENATKLASFICGTPMAVVSLVDDDRQWFKARVGIEAPQTSRQVSFCAHALALDAVLIVPDALLDPRFCDNPLVLCDPRIRFYAGVPLRVDGGSPIGTLCVLDRVPRVLSSQQLDALTVLAKQVETELGLRRRSILISKAQSEPAPSVRLDQLPPPRFPSEPPPASGTVCVVDSSAPTVSASSSQDTGLSPLNRGDLVAGRYVVEDVVGRGGMGVVLRAVDSLCGRTVALKFLHMCPRPDERLVERFVREARILASLHSEHVARIYDVGNLPSGQPFIVMEYLAGTELETLLRQRGPLEISLACDLWRQAAEGVAAAHQAGIVHRDVKPSNMFILESHGQHVLKLLDFGVAKLHVVDGGPELTTADDLVGTFQYMSPEQVLGSATVDQRSDVWALGIVAYRMLTGRLPFDGQGPMQVCAGIIQQDALSVRSLRPDVPEPLARVVTRCLEREASRRFEDAGDLLRAMRALPES